MLPGDGKKRHELSVVESVSWVSTKLQQKLEEAEIEEFKECNSGSF